MKFSKRIISNLTKCYAVSPLQYHGKKHYVVASEKDFPCLLFAEDGTLVSQIWPGEPGGTMSLVPLEGADGVFLATQKFYSPNDSKQSKIVMVSPNGSGGWQVVTLAELPHVHRFDILKRNGYAYLIACTICSGRDYMEDWSHPGKVYGCVLPENLTEFDGSQRLQLDVIKDHLLKNHGYLRYTADGNETGLVTCEQGVFQFIPPDSPVGEWRIEQLLAESVSDIAMVDLDTDGVDEMVTIGPFHGDILKIHKLSPQGTYYEIYRHPEPLAFAHAIWGGVLCGQPAAVIGHRKGSRDLLCLTASEHGTFDIQVIDHDTGAANVLHDLSYGNEILIATNREINEVAIYTVSPA